MKFVEIGKYDTIRRRDTRLARYPDTSTYYADTPSALYQKAEHYLLTDFP